MAETNVVILALVTIIAIVGLIMLGSATTGAIPSCPYYCMTLGELGDGVWTCQEEDCGPMPTAFPLHENQPRKYTKG